MEKTVNWLKTLPYVEVDNCRDLPKDKSGVYFVVSTTGEVLYVGMTSVGYRTRWADHEKKDEILKIDDQSLIYYWAQALEKKELMEVEYSFIDLLNPPLNKSKNLKAVKPQKPRISFIADDELLPKLKSWADEEYRTVSNLVEAIVKDAVDKREGKQAGIRKALAVLQQLSDDPVYAEAISTLQRGLTD